MAKTTMYVQRQIPALTGATRYMSPGIGSSSTSTADNNDTRAIVTIAGTYRNLLIRTTANAATSASTFSVYIDGVIGNSTVSIPAGAPGVGEFYDPSGSDAVTVNQTTQYRLVNGGGGTISFTIFGVAFDASVKTSVPMGTFNNMIATASSTCFDRIAPDGLHPTTETADMQNRVTTAGRFRAGFARVTSSTRSTDTTYGQRYNGLTGGGAGTSSIVVTAGNGGTFPNYVSDGNSDEVVVGDLYDRYGTFGSGTGAAAGNSLWMFETDNQCQMWVNTNTPTDVKYTASTTYYEGVNGQIQKGTSESAVQTRVTGNCVVSGFQCYLVAGTLGATITFRKNGGAATQQIVIPPSSSAGWFSDSTHSDILVDGDEVDIEAVTTATGTDLDIAFFGFKVVISPTPDVYTPYLIPDLPQPTPRMSALPTTTPADFSAALPGLGYSTWAPIYPTGQGRRPGALLMQSLAFLPVLTPTPTTAGPQDDVIHLGTKESLGVTSQPALGGWQAW